jgi:hypothetical protein
MIRGTVIAYNLLVPTLKEHAYMEKIQKLELMDKISRELEDLAKSQTSLLKKVAQIAAHNITLGVGLLDEKLPQLETEADSTLALMTNLSEEFSAYRDKFFTDNKLAAVVDPTA